MSDEKMPSKPLNMVARLWLPDMLPGFVPRLYLPGGGRQIDARQHSVLTTRKG
jgi:hypothetical protein